MLNGFTNVSITNDLTKDIKKSLEDLAKKLFVLVFQIVQNIQMVKLLMQNCYISIHMV
ncbi:hypothetical protein NE167_17475 [Clostridium botulinum]|uniref:hypothetical protein n=1 Tax=Clostridium botulinum TaxID=1491 RepID=UPI002147BC70|nr:hypothetical protein [Clostridium botulinum]MCR1178844.1 hypothetical protein [Clostridium botulinum]